MGQPKQQEHQKNPGEPQKAHTPDYQKQKDQQQKGRDQNERQAPGREQERVSDSDKPKQRN